MSALMQFREHPRHLILLAVVGGMLVGSVAPVFVVAVALLAAGVAGRGPLAIVAVLAALGGAAVSQARVEALGPGKLAALTGRTIEARAILLEPTRQRADGSAVARIRIAGRAVIGSKGRRLATEDLAGEMAVARAEDGRAPPGIRVGSELRLSGRLVPLRRSEAFQRRRDAHAAIAVDAWAATGAARGGVEGWLDSVRERAAHGLEAGLDAPEAALLRGMVLGQDERIAEDVREDFRRAGLAHLLAVSGQNVLLLCTLVLALCAFGDVPLRSRLLAAAAIVALYVPLAGGGPSIQRAGVMGVAGLVAALAGRPASRWYALGLAALVTLALNPLAAGDPGWQLSFAAVVGLLALAPRLREWLSRRRVPEPLADVGAITLAATLATAPLMAFHFEQISLASLPANLLTALVVAPIMWLGMLALALAQLEPSLALPLNVACAPLLGYVEWIAREASSAPLAAVPLRLSGPLVALAYLLPVGVVLASMRWRARIRGSLARIPAFGVCARIALAPAVAAAVVVGANALHARPPALQPGELMISFLDVGQGDAVLLQRDGSSVLFDTGPPGGPILRRLEEAGVERLDLLVITHAEADHEGMALPVIAAYRPRLVLDGGAGWQTAVQRALPAALARGDGRAVAAHAGQALKVGALRVRVLWPPAPAPGWRPDGNPNDRAVVAHVEDGAFDILLPADAESNVTAPLELPRVEVLKVAHHGSADEGLPELLERTSPQVAAILVGRNSYGHPTPSTLQALKAVPRLVRTDRDGTVRLRVTDGRIELEAA